MPDPWPHFAAAAALAGIVAYAVLAGADFGGGVWDLFARGPRRREQRLAIQHAMGPVWEANHVWLIFVVVILFTCFPRAFAALNVALFIPFHLALLGIMLRGASFVFRSYHSRTDMAADRTSAWGVVFGVASLITPLVLGAVFGVVTEGAVRAHGSPGTAPMVIAPPGHWLSPYCLVNGLLAVSTCAYLAAVYLTNETHGALRDDFHRRALLAGTTTAALAALALVLSRTAAPWFFDRLISLRTAPVLLGGLLCFAGSAWTVATRRYRASRAFAAAQVALVLIGWGLAQYPYLVYPDLTLSASAAPTTTVRFLVLALIPGAAILLPSLWYLFRVFKSTAAH